MTENTKNEGQPDITERIKKCGESEAIARKALSDAKAKASTSRTELTEMALEHDGAFLNLADAYKNEPAILAQRCDEVGLSFLGEPPEDPISCDIAAYRAYLDSRPLAYPAFEWGLRWCELHAPQAPTHQSPVDVLDQFHGTFADREVDRRLIRLLRPGET